MILFDAALDWLAHGLWDLAWCQLGLITLSQTHVTKIIETVN